MGIYTLGDLFRETVIQNGDKPALGFVGEKVLSYSEVGKSVKALSAFLEKSGFEEGDKIALLGTNSPNWGIVYFSIVTMGLVVVPILPDFHEDEIENIIKHSESKALFVSESMLGKVKSPTTAGLIFTALIDSLCLVKTESDGNLVVTSNSVVEENAYPEDVYQIGKDDIASIIYTSGTTGKSKGVMLSHWNLVFTVLGSMKLHYVQSSDRFVSILPLSHTLENTVGFLLPFHAGASVAYLRKLPTPAVLLPALKKVRPTIMLAVPLIIEKIYKGKILPEINSKAITKALYKFKPTRVLLSRIAGRKLMGIFGGELEFFGIGGAKLDPTVEQFLVDAKFPYAIGYGLTETAPLLAGFDVFKGKYQSTGSVMDGVTLRINEPDGSGEGEIWAKGDNVMKGYFKEPELTAEVITPDGWFRTGDLGNFDKDGFLFIKGRLKNMIVGASGENIYPEEIEAVINEFEYVLESIVVQQKGRLVAMVHFNREELEKKFMHLKEKTNSYIDDHIEHLRAELLVFVNSRVNRFSRVQMIISHAEPFEKTATKKIKRFLYNQ